MDDAERYRLHHGPYSAPACRRGDTLECEVRGEAVKVGGLTDAPIPWPRVLKTGRIALIVCGDLARAVRVESRQAVAHHWGVTPETVWKWRKALGVEEYNEGTRALHRGHYPEKITPESFEKMAETHRTPEARERMAEIKRGTPAHPNTAKGLRRAAKRKKPAAHRRAIAWAHVLRNEGKDHPPVDPADRPWTPAEDRLLGKTLDRAVAEQIGRTVAAVRNRRHHLGIPESRHSRLYREPRKGLPGDEGGEKGTP